MSFAVFGSRAVLILDRRPQYIKTRINALNLLFNGGIV